MPSVHVCWSVLVAWAVITASTSRWRWLILAHPIVTVFVVVATGNHYWADGIVSVAIVTVVLAVQALLRGAVARFRERALTPEAEQTAFPLPAQSQRAAENMPAQEKENSQPLEPVSAGQRRVSAAGRSRARGATASRGCGPSRGR
jgi:hypothetical protein